METGNLLILMVDQKKEINAELLNNTWLELQDYYYSNTNKQSFGKFKRNINAVTILKAEITACKAGFELAKLGLDDGWEILKDFKINSTNENEIRSTILRKETKLDFAKNKLNTNSKKEAISFYKTVASVERNLDRQLNLSEIHLERWVAYLEEIRIKHELETKALSNTKRKRNGR
jgi:hypothetical protein